MVVVGSGFLEVVLAVVLVEARMVVVEAVVKGEVVESVVI